MNEAEEYELYYSTGGHGGPHQGLEASITHANKLMAGNPNEKWIDIHLYNAKGHEKIARLTSDVSAQAKRDAERLMDHLEEGGDKDYDDLEEATI